MFDPRLTEEYCGLAGMPWSDQDASGELAAMAIGAVAVGPLQPDRRVRLDAHQARHRSAANTAIATCTGCRAARSSTAPAPSGLHVADWQDLILVNMLGKRFYDETGEQFIGNNYNSIDPYVPGSYLNAKNINYNPQQLHQRGDGRHRRRP